MKHIDSVLHTIDCYVRYQIKKMSLKLQMSTAEARLLQQKLADKVLTKDVLPKKLKSICGVDASYKGGMVRCAAVIFDYNQKKVVESVTSSLNDAVPYIPGFFMLKESRPIFHTLKKLEKKFDHLLVDGNGQLHPRQCGLACYVGLMLDKTVIGVAKKLLCGTVQSDSKVKDDGKVVGFQINQGKKKIFVSIGNKISLKTAVKIVKHLTLEQNWYPEPLRLADLNSKSVK